METNKPKPDDSMIWLADNCANALVVQTSAPKLSVFCAAHNVPTHAEGIDRCIMPRLYHLVSLTSLFPCLIGPYLSLR